MLSPAEYTFAMYYGLDSPLLCHYRAWFIVLRESGLLEELDYRELRQSKSTRLE